MKFNVVTVSWRPSMWAWSCLLFSHFPIDLSRQMEEVLLQQFDEHLWVRPARPWYSRVFLPERNSVSTWWSFSLVNGSMQAAMHGCTTDTTDIFWVHRYQRYSRLNYFNITDTERSCKIFLWFMKDRRTKINIPCLGGWGWTFWHFVRATLPGSTKLPQNSGYLWKLFPKKSLVAFPQSEKFSIPVNA